MKLIKPSVKIIDQKEGLQGIYEAIELAGRTCYKSEDKITDTSAEDFVNRMINSKHYAMLEFGTVYLKIEDISSYIIPLYAKYEKNKYSITKLPRCNEFRATCFVTTNLRVLVENGWLDDLKYICEPTEYHEKRICVKFTTDKGVSHELVRHRVFSFAQESTRFCNYSKDKFGNELTFIIPSWSNLKEGIYECFEEDDSIEGFSAEGISSNEHISIENCDKLDLHFLKACDNGQQEYLEMIDYDAKPQQARQVLPNALKTEVNMCGFISDWKHFFSLRSSHAGATGMHPDMDYIANKIYDEFLKRKYIN